MPSLAADHFTTPLEQLPGERIVWEGGPDPRGRWIPYARAGFVGLVLAAVIAWFVGLVVLLPRASRSSPQPVTAAEAQPADSPPAESASPGSWAPLLVLMGAGLLVAVISNVVEARLANRNAWYVVTSERICVQAGVLGRNLTILDIDKVLSVRVSASWLERRCGLLNIEFLHAGSRAMTNGRIATRNEVVMAFVPAGDRLVADVVNSWLPRDNPARRPRG